MSNIETFQSIPPAPTLLRDFNEPLGSKADDSGLHGKTDVGTPLRELGPFLAVAFQFFLIVLLVFQFRLESQTFARLMGLAFVGFFIHHFLPPRVRLPFFATLSVAATIAVVDDVSSLSLTGPGSMLVVIGLALIVVCHLPVAFWGRVGLLVAIAAGLTIVRANSHWLPGLEKIWAVLASMFVFRLMIYLYDLKNHNGEFGIARAVAYFFMIPNACFPLFPIVDYKSFCKTHYNDEPVQIYQTGIHWMFRGIIHLLLYRLIYHYGLLNIAEVRDAADVAQFMVATYLLYLRVSGQFHIIVGLLHMFGFNLPETHHLYYLASSFTDFWRRINIYWKDFIMKLFFYPVSFAFRRAGTVKAVAVATLAAFFATWLLHSWQWFWFRGDFLLTWQDCAFWAILAMLVLVNALLEATYGRRRALATASVGLGARLVVGLKTMATFIVMCALWTLWSSHSADELQVLAESAVRIEWDDALLILCGLALIGVAGAIWGISTRNSDLAQMHRKVASQPSRFWRSAATVSAGAAFALVLPALDFEVHSRPGALLNAMRHDRLNAADLDLQHRGYYEELDVARANQNLWGQVKSIPRGWTEWRIYRGREDFIHCELVPSTVALLCGTPATTNRWGMRDREYAKEKPLNVFRILLLGSSHEVGSGVKDDETFENIVERRMNRELKGENSMRFEILNLSLAGLGMFEKLYLLEEKGFDFDPDAVLFSVNAADRMFMLSHLARVAKEDRPIPYPYLREVFRRAHVNHQLARPLILRRLEPYATEMYDWIFNHLKNKCDRQGVYALVLYRPAPIPVDRRDATRRDELITSARASDFEVLDLSAAYEQVDDRNSLVLADWDKHTNADGHRLLADELFPQLVHLLATRLEDNKDAAE